MISIESYRASIGPFYDKSIRLIYHEGEQANSGHYTSGVKINDRWFLISDSMVLNQNVKLSCTAEDTSVP